MKTPIRFSYFLAAFLWCSFCAMAAFVITCAIFRKELEASHGEFKAFFEFWMIRPQTYPVGVVLTACTASIAFMASRWARNQSARDEAKSRHHGGLTIERWK